MVNDSDFDLIDAYLDDTLSPDEVERLDRRLSHDADFSELLGSMRISRAERSAVWTMREPTEPSSAALAGRIVTAVRRRQRARVSARAGRATVGVAACILFGFVAGWVGRGRSARWFAASPAVQPSVEPSRILTELPVAHDARPVLLTDDGEPTGNSPNHVRHEKPTDLLDDPALGVIVSIMRNDDPLHERLFILHAPAAVRIDEVTPGSPADHAGLQAGDLMLSFGGVPVTSIQTFSAATASWAGRTELEILRDRQVRKVVVQPGK